MNQVLVLCLVCATCVARPADRLDPVAEIDVGDDLRDPLLIENCSPFAIVVVIHGHSLGTAKCGSITKVLYSGLRVDGTDPNRWFI